MKNRSIFRNNPFYFIIYLIRSGTNFYKFHFSTTSRRFTVKDITKIINNEDSALSQVAGNSGNVLIDNLDNFYG